MNTTYDLDYALESLSCSIEELMNIDIDEETSMEMNFGVLESIVLEEEAMEGTSIAEHIKNTTKKISQWWKEKAIPFMAKVVRDVKNWFINTGKKINQLPKKFVKAVNDIGVKFASKVRKSGDYAIIFDSSDTITLSEDQYTVLEATLTDAINKVYPSTITQAIQNAQKELDELNEKIEKIDMEKVNAGYFANIAATYTGPVEDFLKKHRNADKDLEKHIEDVYEETGNSNKAISTGNNWMARVSKFFKSIAEQLRKLVEIFKSAIRVTKEKLSPKSKKEATV